MNERDESDVSNNVSADADVASILLGLPSLPAWGDDGAMRLLECNDLYDFENQSAAGDAVSIATSATSASSNFDDRFNAIIQERQLEENAVIDSVVEAYTLEEDYTVAEVMDTNTLVSDDVIAQWRSKVVVAPDGTIHNKQTLLKNINNTSGMIVSSTPLSMDRTSRVQGKSRHGGTALTDEGTSVARAFKLARGYNPSSQFEDTAEGTDKYMFDDAINK